MTSCTFSRHCLNRSGYPVRRIRGKTLRVSRLVLEEKLGRELKPGLCALHTCDNPACVNPDHLYEGTKRQNTQDAISRGRLQKGERNGRSKISEDQARKIITLRLEGMALEDIAQLFGISAAHVSGICKGIYWKHLSVPRPEKRIRVAR